MAIHFSDTKTPTSKPVYLVAPQDRENAALPERARKWLAAQDYKASEGSALLYPSEDGNIGGAVIAVGNDPFAMGNLAKALSAGSWYFDGQQQPSFLNILGIVIGNYRFSRYVQNNSENEIGLVLPAAIDKLELIRQSKAITHVRDLINTPANDMGPQALEDAVRLVGEHHGADIEVTAGDALLAHNLPLIHAVGRAGSIAPRLIDLHWGPKDAPKITLVGKGVCFDTGGLDIKPPSSMLLMKKDMGGAANVLGLAQMIMDAKLPVRLRVLIPAVENSVAGNAFRPSDILPSRKGISVEVGNTDAEGRLVLADALALGDEETPEIMLDMATLTGAARTALGPDLPPFYTDDGDLAHLIKQMSQQTHDPLWRMPLWQPYMKKLDSPIADINNVTTDGFAGSITAALFLSRFVDKAKSWAHFDIYGWTPVAKPAFPKGGEAQGIRALYAAIKSKYAK